MFGWLSLGSWARWRGASAGAAPQAEWMFSLSLQFLYLREYVLHKLVRGGPCRFRALRLVSWLRTASLAVSLLHASVCSGRLISLCRLV